jgi:Na+-transporting methylmalonyl-CoA/oxaloacetate decarboxylase gamma subunit
MSPCLVVVICMAVVMSGMAAFIGFLLGRRAAAPARTAASPAAPRAGEVTPELVAVLAAAAHAALGKPVVVRRLRVLRPAGQENWSRVGRIDILRSHRVDPKR